ncbi:MAG: hypothetical protein AABX29_00605 [Nanoarchaeota archaeon]
MIKLENQYEKEKCGWINSLADKFINSRYRKYGNNPVGWYISGNCLPGEKQEYILSSMKKWTLKHSITGIAGNTLINGAKVWGGIELLSNTNAVSSNLVDRIQEAGAGGLFLWSGIGLIEIGIRGYYLIKTKKPIASLSVEIPYNAGRGVFNNIISIIKNSTKQ